jgi:hypothetical protein
MVSVDTRFSWHLLSFLVDKTTFMGVCVIRTLPLSLLAILEGVIVYKYTPLLD